MTNVTSLSSTKSKMGVPADDTDPKKKKLKGNYNKYSGIVDENGKSIDRPTAFQAIKTMANFMKNNKSDQSDNPSNVYDLKNSHTSQNYNKKKPLNTA